MKLLTRKEAADMLKVSLRQLDYLLTKDNVPVIKLGSHKNAGIRIEETDLIDWVNNQKYVKQPLE